MRELRVRRGDAILIYCSLIALDDGVRDVIRSQGSGSVLTIFVDLGLGKSQWSVNQRALQHQVKLRETGFAVLLVL